MKSLNNFVDGDSIAIEDMKLYTQVAARFEELGYTWLSGKTFTSVNSHVIDSYPEGVRLHIMDTDDRTVIRGYLPKPYCDSCYKLSEVFELCDIVQTNKN